MAPAVLLWEATASSWLLIPQAREDLPECQEAPPFKQRKPKSGQVLVTYSWSNGDSLVRGVGQKRSKASVKKTSISSLIHEPAVVLFGQASLIMSNLRTKGREDVGGGYMNRTAGGQRG